MGSGLRLNFHLNFINVLSGKKKTVLMNHKLAAAYISSAVLVNDLA